MKISEDIFYAGVNDHLIDLFEGQYKVPNGMAYNSYVIEDEKIAVMDTVDRNFTHEWLDNLQKILGSKQPDYLIIQHMEPDHSANIAAFIKTYPNAVLVASAKAFQMMLNFFGSDYANQRIVIADGHTLCLGSHTLKFIAAPMVHWPEVIVTYDEKDKILFSADAFGKFGALDADEPWDDEARRYYIGIVGKYGPQVQTLLKKTAALDIKKICSLHGPVLDSNLEHYITLYNTWSSYEPEEEGIVIAYTSVYGHTRDAVLKFADSLKNNGCPCVVIHDLARCDQARAVADAFRYSRLVLATTTYNADIFPPMKEFIHHLLDRNFQNRTLALIENGSWAPLANKVMKSMFEKSKNITFCSTAVQIKSALSEDSTKQLDALSNEICQDFISLKAENASKTDLTALFKIGYGLYVVTSNDGKKDNGLIVNTVTQVTNSPNRIAVTINKENYSHHVIKQSGILNINCLSVDAPFKIFQTFGFQSGRNTDKFEGLSPLHSANGLAILPRWINAVLSLKVESYVDLDTHGMFICTITEARTISQTDSMTYDWYHKNVKPKPETKGKKGYVCKICGWVYEGDELPPDIVCPLCKHGAADFEPIE